MRKFLLIGLVLLLASSGFAEGENLDNPILVGEENNFEFYLTNLSSKYFKIDLKQGEQIKVTMSIDNPNGGKKLDYVFLDSEGNELSENSKCYYNCSGVLLNNHEEKEIYLKIRAVPNALIVKNIFFEKTDYSDLEEKEAPENIEDSLEIEENTEGYCYGLGTKIEEDYLFISLDKGDSYSYTGEGIKTAIKGNENCRYSVYLYKDGREVKSAFLDYSKEIELTNTGQGNHQLLIEGECKSLEPYSVSFSENIVEEVEPVIIEEPKQETVEEQTELPKQETTAQAQKLEEMQGKNEIKQGFMYLMSALVLFTLILIIAGFIKKED